MRDIIAMVLAGGRVEELSVLTQIRPKAAVPFAGQYRIIDFALSGLMTADIQRVGVLSLFRPSSLIDHVGTGEPWDFIGRGRGVKILPPYTAETTSQWYRGTSDAIYQNLNFICDHNPRDVLILSGDHVHNVDISALIQQHRQTNADLTMVVKKMDREQGRGRFGFAQVEPDGQVSGYQEKPEDPKSDLVSLTMYLFRTDVLVRRLEENMRTGRSWQIYSEILPAMIHLDRVFAFIYQGYWNYARSVESYHQAHMDLLGNNPEIRLGDWSIRTRKQLKGLGDLPPLRIHQGGRCIDSLVSPGVCISGSVASSVLSPGVRIESGAQVRRSVLLHNVVVREGAHLCNVVIDKEVEVGKQAQIGLQEACQTSRSTDKAITVIGKRALIPPTAKIGHDCVIFPATTPDPKNQSELKKPSHFGSHEGGAA